MPSCCRKATFGSTPGTSSPAHSTAASVPRRRCERRLRRRGLRSRSTTRETTPMVMPYRETPGAYTLLAPPFPLDWREMTRQQLRDHFAWFLDVLPRRIDELEAEVRRWYSFATWRADLS